MFNACDHFINLILQIIKNNFDFRPGMIARQLDLKKPRYLKTACYGHFGRNDPNFTWEMPKQLSIKTGPPEDIFRK